MPITLSPSSADTRKFKVAAVQAEPVWLDLQGGVEKTIRIIREAAAEGAKIIGFPEVFIPGYPWTPWSNTFVEAAPVLKEYQANALPLHSPEMERICEAVKEADVNIVLGFAERDGASLYIAQVTITQDGKIANHRRKIKSLQPTHYEKTVFGDGSAQSIYNVVQTPYGRVGSLNCWEHIQPWLKTHFYAQHPQIFVGGWWPAFGAHQGGSPYIVSGEASSRMTQLVSMEGGCFGLVCCHVVSEAGAQKMKMLGFPWFTFPGGGFSTIYGPDGSTLADPVDPGQEAILYADISLDKINEVKLVADTMGNYSRFDLFHTVVQGKNWAPARYIGKEEEEADILKQNEVPNAANSFTYKLTLAAGEPNATP
ncbi:carbon-nitrogen hydrolase [Dendrothele bispora CBS 962.96]|uniref:Carbon-nitrogen hydrolase n=1 Tax=Dendrothele bispora (strain CBS 962.96) TaxID=1314807 RepID=A0A4S8MWE7_DENBC|nr:carbon-nitrogen hydrolase [Dendrothele bispora CBS 962.96]